MPASEILSYDDAAHLLRRAGFGGRRKDVRALKGLSRADAVDSLLDFEGDPVPRPPDRSDESEWQQNLKAMEWWMTEMATTEHPLREKLTLFWHGHFATSWEKVDDQELMNDQLDLLRRKGLGDFAELCTDVSLGPAMIIYLDNETNVVGAEQENFARELMELHTIGVGNFSEADVVSMAKAWTGHNTVGWVKRGGEWIYDSDYIFRRSEHDSSIKSLFGISKKWNATGTIQELVHGSKQQLCADFVARKMWKFFATAEPSPAVMTRLTSAFISSGMVTRSLVRSIFLEDDFWAPDARYALLRSPVEYVVAILRVTKWDADEVPVRWYIEPMGQVLFSPPNVAGWGTDSYWLSTATAWARSRFASEWQCDYKLII